MTVIRLSTKRAIESCKVLILVLSVSSASLAIQDQKSGSSASARGHAVTAEYPTSTWHFAVSGDSRNCGDVVMPAIALDVAKHAPAFYWHLGDFRFIYEIDDDMKHGPDHLHDPLDRIRYERTAWDDFLINQIAPFGSVAVFLGIGNHETVLHKDREDYLVKFADWLEAPVLREQRLKDDPEDHRVKTYYHWVDRGVDFINLDNASEDQFDADQLRWFEQVLKRDESDATIQTLVVGMHAALPESISLGHSMNQSDVGEQSGRQVYEDLLKTQNNAHKHVYVLASHSHFYMDGTFNTDYWRSHGGVLPGWIIGTGGAVRYALPKNWRDARQAMTNIYGYLLGTVNPGGGRDGVISFQFQQLHRSDVPPQVKNRFDLGFVDWCFDQNTKCGTNKPDCQED